MMASIPAYNAYAQAHLMPELDPAELAEIQEMEATGRHTEPRYEELLAGHYERHVLRMPRAEWPEPVVRSFAHINPDIYVPMQGPSELGASGALAEWDRTADLPAITVPTLTIGAAHDTMDPAHMAEMATRVGDGTHVHCPNGSHLAMYDDQQTYLRGLIDFLTR